ncbi:hypothetical protein [Streptomyces sp. NPDC048442]|uniref:hypothetical protein n=1 Tax=Streptomyces sp. NPDC048442 TaxID=3154823 RepID=UPI00342231B2
MRLAYLVLPPHLGRNRRVLTAHSLVQRALPRGRTGQVPQTSQTSQVSQTAAGIPVPRGTEEQARPGESSARERGHAFVRQQVLRQALEAEPPLLRKAWPKRAQLPPLLPQVWGLRLFPKSGGADELALDQRLAALSGAGRAAYVLRGLERLDDDAVRGVLRAAKVAEPDAALAEADTVEPSALLESAEFDPCSLQARPTDLMRRRQHTRASLAVLAALVVCAVVLTATAENRPGASNPAGELALDPSQLTRTEPAAWKSADRTDFSAWPARGPLADDAGLLRRALAEWAAPSSTTHVSATPGTPTGPAMGPPQLLYAGELDGVRVVLLHDGLRLVRYAEPANGAGDGADSDRAGTGVDFARVDGATEATANAIVVTRTATTVRYLTAPWADQVSVRDLLAPTAAPRALRRTSDGVTAPVAASSMARDCRTWDAMEVRDSSGTRTLTDLGELLPARLTAGPAAAPADLKSVSDRASWAHTACLLPTLRSHGVRSVNSWAYASQTLPESNGTARWLCTRAETWQGPGSQVLAQFQQPGTSRSAPGAIVARAENTAACGAKGPEVLAGVMWKSKAGKWYLLAAGNDKVASVSVRGGVRGSSDGNVLAVPAGGGAQANLTGKLKDGTKVNALR